MKHIGIDCRLWSQTGIGRYTQNIVNELSKMDSENKYTLFFLSEDIGKVKLPQNFNKVKADVRWYTFKEQLLLPLIFYKHRLDVLFIPNLNVPVLYVKKFVVTIHDLTHTKVKTGRASTLPYPLYRAKKVAMWLPLYYSGKFSRGVFTVSEYVKGEILEKLKINEKKIYVTPNAVDEKFMPQPKEKIAQTLKKYHVATPYIFYVGNAHPHKNLERLILAFEIVNKKIPELTLVLGGKKTYFYERLQNESKTKQIYSHLIFTDFIEDDDLPALYAGAEAFVNPSLEEGFGIQVLESFACGTKVVCSNRSSLPEVGGNIAYYFNPYDINRMAETIINCVKDHNEKRKEAGFKRAREFTWYESAKTVYDVIMSV